jgi:hypothetical protein
MAAWSETRRAGRGGAKSSCRAAAAQRPAGRGRGGPHQHLQRVALSRGCLAFGAHSGKTTMPALTPRWPARRPGGLLGRGRGGRADRLVTAEVAESARPRVIHPAATGAPLQARRPSQRRATRSAEPSRGDALPGIGGPGKRGGGRADGHVGRLAGRDPCAGTTRWWRASRAAPQTARPAPGPSAMAPLTTRGAIRPTSRRCRPASPGEGIRALPPSSGRADWRRRHRRCVCRQVGRAGGVQPPRWSWGQREIHTKMPRRRGSWPAGARVVLREPGAIQPGAAGTASLPLRPSGITDPTRPLLVR